MREKLEFLYYRYYKLQVKMGNADIAPFSSILSIATILMLYFFDIMFIISIISNGKAPFLNVSVVCLSLLFLIGFLYIILVNNGKYKIIIKEQEKEVQKRYSLLAILFPLIAFILFVLSMIFKIIQNRGN
jgi:glucan phosphoethanolaminetransferase (alkaline phosphatase superfamily)